MRIGIYSPRAGFSRAGGTEALLREMAGKLQGRHEITIYCGEGDILKEVRELDVSVEQIPLIKKEDRRCDLVTRHTPILPAEIESLSMYWNARRQGIFNALDAEVDVLSTHYYLDNLLVSRTVSVPNLFHYPGIQHPSIRWRAMLELAEPDAYLANSESTANRLREWYGHEVDGIVYPGADLEQFTPDVEPAFESDEVSVLFVGRLDEGKGLPDLIEAQSRLNGVTKLYLVGDGTLEDDLRQQAANLGIEDDVEFVGPIPHEEVQHYYAAADIFCLPSYHEGFPLVNIEALASGCAVVSTTIDSIEEYLDDGENGLLVDPGDVDALTEVLRRLAENDALRERLASKSRETAQPYSWEAQAERLEVAYERIRRESV